MVLRKILIIGIKESSIEESFWNRIDKICEEKIFFNGNMCQIESFMSEIEGILVKFDPITVDFVNKFPNLKYIGTIATGCGKIAIDHATQKHITVTNVPGYSTESVAEFTIGVLLDYARELTKSRVNLEKGNIDESIYKAFEIKNKEFGIIGLGDIGRRVGELANGFGAKVFYWNRTQKENANSFKYRDINSLISTSDIVSIHLSLNDETNKFFNEEKINSLKPNSILINTCPMELIDSNALKKRLSKKDITFIWDHPDEVEQSEVEEFRKFENCITYPPIGYITKEAKINQQEIFVSNIENFVNDKSSNIVNR